MCTCASCKYTDSFSGLPELVGDDPRVREREPNQRYGFKYWPRGEPAGPRSSASAYARHQTACPPIAKPYKAEKFGAPRHSVNGINGPLQSMPQWWYAWNNKASPTYAELARPARPGKAEQHFPAQDRPRETARIYAMPKAKKTEAKRGRPPLPGRRVVIKLEEEQIKRAETLGGGNVAAGIRKALASK